MSTDPAARPLPRAGAARRLAPLAVLALVLLTLLGPATPAAAGGPQASDLLGSRPDIIVLMLDDMNADAFPRVLARLPALKAQFVDQGIRFPNTFAENPLCCPARANFLTGLTTAHNGVNNNDARHLDRRRPQHAVAADAAALTLCVVAGDAAAERALADHSSGGEDGGIRR